MGTNEEETIALRANNPINLAVDGNAWVGITGMIKGDPHIGRPDIYTFDTMEHGMRAGLLNNFTAQKRRPTSTILEQVVRHIEGFNASRNLNLAETKGAIQFLDQNNIPKDVKLRDVDIMRFTKMQGLVEGEKQILFDDPRWQVALDMLRDEGLIPPNIRTEEEPRR